MQTRRPMRAFASARRMSPPISFGVNVSIASGCIEAIRSRSGIIPPHVWYTTRWPASWAAATSGASNGATNRSKIFGEMTVDDASPPPSSSRSNGAPAVDRRNASFRSRSTPKRAVTQPGSS